MNTMYRYLIVLVFGCILGYLFNVVFQIYVCNYIPMSFKDIMELILTALGCLGTFGAVIVALFKDDIERWFKKVKFEFCLSSDSFIELTEGPVNEIRAISYYNNVIIQNTGNIYANNCELYLESAQLYNEQNKVIYSITPDNEPINWSTQTTLIGLPIKGKKSLKLFELFEPEHSSDPNGTINTSVPIFQFLGVKNGTAAEKGKWKITYCLMCQNTEPFRFCIDINWNGEWRNRKADMENQLTIKLETI